MPSLVRVLFACLAAVLLFQFSASAAKNYSLKNKADKIVELSVEGVSPKSVFVELKGSKTVEIPWETLDLEWIEKNSKEILDAREYAIKLAADKAAADKKLETLKREKDPVAITGRVLGVSKNAVIIRARGIPPKGKISRAMTSRTSIAAGLCFVENVPDIKNIKEDDYCEVIAYENGTFDFKPSYFEANQQIKKYFARDDSRQSIFDKDKPDFVSIESFFERDTKQEKTRTDFQNKIERPAVCTGSGYLIKGGYVITAYHVVDGGNKINVTFKNAQYPAKIVSKNKGLDVAILKLEKMTDGLVLHLQKSPRIGESVFTLGYPNIGVQGLSIKFTSGDINALSGLRDDENFMQISVPLQPGNSGGPLFDMKGNFLGVIVSRLNDSYSLNLSGYVPQNVNYASKGRNLTRLLNELGIEVGAPKEEKKDKAEIIEEVREYCVFITSGGGA